MKIKAKTKECKLIVKVKTSGSENIDVIELARFGRVFIRGFLKPKLIKNNLIEYTGPVGVSLYDRLRKPITKRDFLFIMEQIVVAVQKLTANNFPINNLIVNLHNIYINEATKEVQFIYIPLKFVQNNTNLIDLIESIVYSVKPAEDRDSDFASRFIYHFKSLNNFDINKVESFIAKEDRSVVNIIRKQNAGQSGFMTNKQQHYYDHYGEQKSKDSSEYTQVNSEKIRLNIEYDPTKQYVLNEDSNKIEDEVTGLLLDYDEEQTGLLLEDEEGTALLDENEETIHYPTLHRVLTEESISVNKPVFRLGKEKSYVDYFVTNNIAVSRSHADIITRGNKCYVVDLNSKNHTYINGQIIPVQCEVEINNGDKLKLGNEEFIFHM